MKVRLQEIEKKIGIGIERYINISESLNTWKKAFIGMSILSLMLGGVSIVKILSGTTVNENVKKIKIVELEKIKFLGEDNERK
ncbi:hypothetical protein KX935_03690 [Streptobacillus moniliformis]|nr:hypothetical protein KX935_03690 [Streptobacillus moniliformis]